MEIVNAFPVADIIAEIRHFDSPQHVIQNLIDTVTNFAAQMNDSHFLEAETEIIKRRLKTNNMVDAITLCSQMTSNLTASSVQRINTDRFVDILEATPANEVIKAEMMAILRSSDAFQRRHISVPMLVDFRLQIHQHQGPAASGYFARAFQSVLGRSAAKTERNSIDRQLEIMNSQENSRLMEECSEFENAVVSYCTNPQTVTVQHLRTLEIRLNERIFQIEARLDGIPSSGGISREQRRMYIILTQTKFQSLCRWYKLIERFRETLTPTATDLQNLLREFLNDPPADRILTYRDFERRCSEWAESCALVRAKLDDLLRGPLMYRQLEIGVNLSDIRLKCLEINDIIYQIDNMCFPAVEN
ncbi:hypothetical protein BKA69DRAFT_1040996 [Paraphysoderma sedebokerense]|nr:hypothetical protein BKA69DRAFT_1040996 [Paraphysoderma sedebokerense]